MSNGINTKYIVPKSFVGANDGDTEGDVVGALVVIPLSEHVVGGASGGQYKSDEFPFANCAIISR